MNRGYIFTIIFVILAVTARRTVSSDCPDCNTPCQKRAQYDRAKCNTYPHNYCECSSAGKGTSKDCGNYYFDETTESCIWENSVSASASNPNDDYKLTEYTCSGKPDNFMIPETTTNCTSYFLCTGGVKAVTAVACPDFTLLNPMIGDCVPEDTYVCNTTQSERLPECDPSGSSKFYSDKEDCAGYYYCIDGVRVKGKCDAQKYDFDPIGQRCAYKSGKCKPVLISKSSDSATKDFDWETICKGQSGKFLTDPRVCTAYILCISETKPRQDFCKEGTYFNNGFCSKTPPKTCNCELVDTASLNQGQIIYAPHEDKNKFYICSKTGREEKTCPQGTIWNDKAASCVMS